MVPPPAVSVKVEFGTVEPSAGVPVAEESNRAKPSKVVVLADLNFVPPQLEDNDSVHAAAPVIDRLTNNGSYLEKSTSASKEADAGEIEGKKVNKVVRCRSRSKIEPSIDFVADADGDQSVQGVPSSREEKVSSLKTGLVHVARKMPKNAHAHFILGLMYQRLGQPQKAVPSYEKAAEILLGCEPEIARPDLLSLVQIHHAQCLLLEGVGDYSSGKELEVNQLEEILSKLKESMQLDCRQAAVWNTLGLMLLKTGCLQSAISVLSSLLPLVPDDYDCLANLGIAYLQSGNLELSARLFQDLLLKDQSHPTALLNYAALLLCKHGSVVAGSGANSGECVSSDQITAVNVAKECLLAALRVDPRAAHTWANLANAYYLIGDHRSSRKCLEKAAQLEPNCMSTRYAVSVHRVKEAERSQDASEQLSWSGNEMASIIREGDAVPIDPPIAWAGLAMVHKAQHEIAAAFISDQKELTEVEDRALYCLKQAVAEDPDDSVPWHQLGIHSLCSQQYKAAQKYLKASVARSIECSYAWSNLGISLQLSDEHSQAEDIYKRAMELATSKQAHSVFSNIGNLYRQKKQLERAKAMLSKSLELKPGYAPAYNNLGLVFVAEGQWEEAKFCFEKALEGDALLDAAKSNLLKASALSRLCRCVSSNGTQD